jgi:hypothetical protein
MDTKLKSIGIVVVCAVFVSFSGLFADKFEDFKLIDENKKLVRGGGGGNRGGGRSGARRNYASGRSRMSSSRSSMGAGRHSGRSVNRSSRSHGTARPATRGIGSSKRSHSRHAVSKGSRHNKSKSKVSKSSAAGRKGASKNTRGIQNKSSKTSKVNKSGKSGQTGHASNLTGKRAQKRSNKIASHHSGKNVTHNHYHKHYHNHYHDGPYWGRGWGCVGVCGGVFIGFGAMYPFWYPFSPIWGPYWATPWPWAAGLGLYYYPGPAWWYMNSYNCWVYPFAGLGYGLMFADLGYYWYPRAGVSIYLEVPEKDEAPSTYVFVENEKNENLYYAMYRKINYNNDDQENSYLVKISQPHVINTKKVVKVYLPEDVSKDKEYVVIARRNKSDLKNSMDEKGNDINPNIIDQIKEENKDIKRAHDVKIQEPSKEEVQEIKETKQSARKNEKKLTHAIDNIDKQDKSKLPTKEQLEKEKGQTVSEDNQREEPVKKSKHQKEYTREVDPQETMIDVE